MSFDDRWSALQEPLLEGLEGDAELEGIPGKRTLTMQMPARQGPIQRQVDAGALPATDPLQPLWLDAAVRPDLHLHDLPLQRKSSETAGASDATGSSGRQMPENVQHKMERAFGVDFSAVRIHEGGQASAVGALAYTQGTDIHFAPGQYDPTSQGGQELLGHELTHVVQQASGRVAPTIQAKGVDINDDAALERDADELGARAARGQPVGVSGAAIIAPTSAPAIQRKKNTIADDPADPQNAAAKGTGQGLLKNSGGKIQEGVVFGPLHDDCATSMEAWINANDYDAAGSEPKAGTWPSWWAAAAPKVNNYWVRGHLLNHNLGGPGEKRNLTPITKAANSEHHNNVEKVLKLAGEVGGSLIGYKVVARYDGTGPTALAGDANDPDSSVWPKLTLGFDCEYIIIIDETNQKSFTTFVENKR